MGGLNTILSFKNKVEEAEQELSSGSLMQELVLEHEKEIVEANKEQLYEFGQNPLGISLGSYSPYTIKRKIEKGQPYDRVTLKDSGDFYAGFHLEADNTGFTITSSDWKTGELLARWGQIFGLTVANRLHLAWTLPFPALYNRIKSILI